ncbi:zinc dependent phospholipase C family protein [Pseudalkalibacillus berkeleyi]|uniref:Zinc dependent phospholipase C family protein n=1 Tax=Pseudalkalibacillus berkeleyi TaxID=1069813 RepID=A0ABS9H1T1_9BACL|nr:zinc dependent phospholipase C family protein [Pseudalkalibacillus berkeleyi]MCF6137780.1 zinc dependent phospholipase C family protein [Pseudalkalibacillus berkeleyi]
MATWVTHFRITEELLKEVFPVSTIDFLVGNIGPDCGLKGENGKPNPPKEITHFKIDGKINSDYFYDQYLRNWNEDLSSEFSYYLGYYIHLVTDEEWIKLLKHKKKEEVYQAILNTPEYANLVKRDWYGLDFLYLKDHKENIFWTEFQHITDFPEYLSFFPKGQTLKQIRNITEFYQSNKVSTDHKFIYLASYEVDEFVDNTVQKIKILLKDKIKSLAY